jgi:puromycin-sensitive aminopeptidase
MSTRMSVAVVGVLCVLTLVAAAQRLPRTAIPEHYDLHLTPDFATDTFRGEVQITLRLAQPTSSISLNAAELEFAETSITAAGRTQPARVVLDAQLETATLTVAEPLPAGAATVSIRYSGRLNDRLRGFYLSQANGRKYAVTQLEATDARRAFPSFDEPSMKATFAITATVDARDTAISNGRLLSDTPVPGGQRHTLKFATTAKMSPYLVALLVGDWECVRGGADGIPIRICATPNHKNELGFALESAENVLRYFNRYFTIKYPFDKLDIIAVPDFSAGAMENTGAIVFREQYLLAAEGESTARRKQIASILGHEIAHQWFGDLVTMEWWDDVWLNEGFATWAEDRPMAEWHPEWNVPLGEVRSTQSAMNLDGLDTTRPIRMRVETPDEINQVFDAIAYQKTAAVLRMVEAYVGAQSYRNGINAYLKKFAFGNATGEGFWTTLAAATQKPVDKILSSYVTQASLPLLTVTSSCVEGRTEIGVSQKPMSNAVPASALWEVPICYKRSRGDRIEGPACEVLSGPSRSLSLAGCSSWVFANVDSRGYYRTSYGPEGLKALGPAVRTGGLTPVEQTSLLEDVWALVRLNQENIADFLALAGELLKGPVSPAIPTVAGRINFVSDYLVDDAQRPAFERWVRQLLRPVLDTLGWNPTPQESEDRKNVRAAVLYTLGYAGRDPEVLSEARRRADLYLTAAGTLDQSLFNTVVQLAAINGDERLYERYLERASRQNAQPGSTGEEASFRNTLSYFANPALRKRTLDYATSAEVRSQDAPAIIAGLLDKPWAANDAWEHVKTNWESLQRTGVFQGVRTIVRATNSFCDQKTRDDIDQFFQTNRISGNDRLARQGLETIDRCIETRNFQSGRLGAWLTAQASPP